MWQRKFLTTEYIYRAKTYPKFIRIDQFLSVIAQTNIQTERQTLNCRTATKFTIEPKWKGDFSNKEKFKK